MTYNLMLLSERRVDLEMRCPELVLDFMGGGILEVGIRDALASCAVSGAKDQRWLQCTGRCEGSLLLQHSS